MLKGKTALVTGSTSGIGLGLAKALAAQGANIVMNGFGEVDAAVAQVKALGVQVSYHGADMSKPAEIEAMVRHAEVTFGGVDILVNNAGIQHVARVENFPPERWDAVIAINLSSAFHASRFALPGMQVRNWGRILNIASLQSHRAFANSAPYGAGKGGIVQLTRAMALEWGPHGITCNAIGPGFFPTALTAPVFDNPELVARHAAQTCLGRNGELSDIYGLTVFLASDASAYLTGQTIMLDGGYTAK